MAKNNNPSANMKKRAALSTGRRSLKKTKRDNGTSIESLPKDMLSEVLARVGASSFTDVFNAKLSCKFFHEVAEEDTHIYQHVSLDPFPLVAWKPLSGKQEAFLARCEACQNPEIMYRRAVIDYFGGKGLESGLRCLQRAANLKHIGAMYTTCIVLLFSGDDESKEIGVKMLASMKKSMHRELKVHRDKLINMLQSIWIENPLLRHRPICCTREDNHKRRPGWSDEEEEEVSCEACSADSEIRFFSIVFHEY